MDLSKLSDADLLALRAGDLTKVSDAGLLALKGQAEPTTAGQDLMRGAGRAARVGVNAVTAVPGMMADAATGVINQFLPDDKKFLRTSVALNNLLDKAGMGGAQNATERVIDDTAAAALGSGAFAKAAEKGGKALEPLAKNIGKQILAAASGGAAASGTREAGGGTLAQITAGLGGALVPGAASTVMRGVAPNMSAAGRFDVKGRILNEAAGAQQPSVLKSLERSKALIPGEQPTAAQAAAGQNAPAFVALEKQVTQRYRPDLVSVRDAENELARLNAVRGVGQDAAALKSAEGVRGGHANVNYGNAFAQAMKADPTLAVLAKNPYFKDALPTAFKLAEAEGITPKTNLTRFLHLTKLSLDKMLARTGDSTLSHTEKRAVDAVKDDLMQWLKVKNPAYDAARAEFAKDSVPINQMNIGQYLENKLTAPLAGGNERAGSFAQALRDAPGTIKRATGGPRFETLGQAGITPQQQGLLGGVKSSLEREALADKQGLLGTQKARGLLGDTFSPLEPPPLLHRAVTVARFALEKIGINTRNKTLQELAKDMQDPATAAQLMRDANPTQRAAMLEVMRAAAMPTAGGLLQPMAQVQ